MGMPQSWDRKAWEDAFKAGATYAYMQQLSDAGDFANAYADYRKAGGTDTPASFHNWYQYQVKGA